jgi:hypothetical protein
MSDELWRMSAVEAVMRMRKGEIPPIGARELAGSPVYYRLPA